MVIERALSHLFPRSFSAKLLAVTFVGIHIPLILLAVWLIASSQISHREMLVLLAVVLAATLGGTALTLLVLYRLLAPLREAANAMDAYQAEQRLPNLKVTGDDEIGRLMRGINRSVRGIDSGLRDLERHALTDPLTGALNRRGCEQPFADSIASATQGSRPFILFVIDLDNLKQVNDQLGHAAGDQVLMQLVAIARGGLEQGDWIARWGGDEFLIGVHASAASACRRMGELMERLQRDDGHDGHHPVYMSVGAAACQGGQTAADLYRHADAAMYRAKFAGGGQLVCDDSVRAGDDSSDVEDEMA